MLWKWTKFILIPLVLSKIISTILVSNRFWIVLMLGQNEEICTPMMGHMAVLPDSITGQNHELIVLLEGLRHYFRKRNNHLLLVTLLFVPLVEVVTCWEKKQFLVSLVLYINNKQGLVQRSYGFIYQEPWRGWGHHWHGPQQSPCPRQPLSSLARENSLACGPPTDRLLCLYDWAHIWSPQHWPQWSACLVSESKWLYNHFPVQAKWEKKLTNK